MMVRLLLTGWLAVQALSASSSKIWEISDFDGFLQGKLEALSLDDEGRLRLAPRLTTLFESDEALSWATAVAADGSIYLGTGHQGRLYRISPDGKAKLLWQAPEIEIFALEAGPDGALYVATAPHGKVYRVDAKGEAKELYDPQQAYIWDLQLSADGRSLYVATGDEGKIFRMDLSGKGELWLDTGQRHAISLALDPEGRLLAGTDPNGLLYRVDGKDQAFALYDSELPEIRSIAVAPSGEIYFAAMGGAMSLRDQTTQIVSSVVTAGAIAQGQQAGGAGLTAGSAPSMGGGASYSVPTVNYGVETAALFRLRPQQSVDKLWTSKDEDILGLDFDPADPSRLLFITGKAGRLYRIDPDADRLELLAQTDQRQATSLRRNGDTALLSAAYGGALVRLEGSPAAEGVYETGVRDTGGVSQWGRLSWRGEGRIVFETRTGNASKPDGTWSAWSEPIETPGGGPIASPPARFIQWRARLVRQGAEEPLLEQATVSYLPQNQPPTISSVTVKSVKDDGGSGGSSSSNASSSGDSSAAYSITVTASGDASVSSATSTEETRLERNGGERLSITWSASDPDGDELIAAVEFRGEGESGWKTMREDLKEPKLLIDRDALADGRYRFRVRVSDSRSNPPAAARTADKTSAPVLIDHTAPLVTLLERSGDSEARFEARDSASPIAGAEYSVNAGPWTPVRTDDGIADGQAETFTIQLGPGQGERSVTLRVRDRAGNAGLAKTVFP
ncbi:MAG: hypothetical protein GC160_24605 [Acidobacteria bacterium]|nr:hypothetical protein [Acidobacteriota bacterium]